MVCPSPAGGLPLGNILTSKEDEDTSAAISLYQSLLPRGAFFGRGPDVGPKIIMTDDCLAEQNALVENWPSVTLLLCIFHLLQALWRWEWNSEHKIERSERPILFNLFKSLVYAEDEME